MHGLRKTPNVGPMLRICDALWVEKIYFTEPGVSTRPTNDCGASDWVPQETGGRTADCLKELRQRGYHIVAVERTTKSQNYREHHYAQPLAVVLGSERGGIPNEILALCDTAVEIPMRGAGVCINVATALAVILFEADAQLEGIAGPGGGEEVPARGVPAPEGPSEGAGTVEVAGEGDHPS